MDLREKKTKRGIRSAFLELRKNKPLERITVKELAELAEISKATFYLHYRDLYDLSDSLQEEVIQQILCQIQNPENYVKDKQLFQRELVRGFYLHQRSIEILFSGKQSGILPIRIVKEMRSFLHELFPDMDTWADMQLSYQIYGSYFVFQEYHKICETEELLQFLGQTSKSIGEIFAPREP